MENETFYFVATFFFFFLESDGHARKSEEMYWFCLLSTGISMV